MASQFLLFRTLQYKMETFQCVEQPLSNTAIWCLIQCRLLIPCHHSRHPNEKVVNIIYRLEDVQHCFYWYLWFIHGWLRITWNKMESSTSNSYSQVTSFWPSEDVLIAMKHLDDHILVKIHLKMHVVVHLTLLFPTASGKGRACQMKTSCFQIRTVFW